MAYIVVDPNKRRRIQVETPDRKRKTIRLGKVSQDDAELVLTHVKRLSSAVITNSTPPDDTARWLSKIDPKLRDRLARAGLCERPAVTGHEDRLTLKGMIEACIARRVDIKPGTRVTLHQARGHLCRFFGEDRVITKITPAEGDDFRRYMRNKYSEAYTAKTILSAKSFFRDAVRRKLLAESPFAEVKTGTQKNRSRQRMVDRETIQKVIDAAGDPEWRLLIALARFGGLRVPSEPLGLRWTDINWAARRIVVTSPKTAHHEGKDQRVIPLFPELEPYLLAVYEKAEPGTEWVITRYRESNANLRTQLLRYIRRAGVTPWPRLFQNLRSSRQTELQDQFPAFVVCTWLGNSVRVAEDHYLQVTDGHFAAAAGSVTDNEKATRNPTRKATPQAGVLGCNTVQTALTNPQKNPENTTFQPCSGFVQWERQDSNL